MNLPDLFPDLLLHSDYSLANLMGVELGRLLDLASTSPLAPLACRIHAFGSGADPLLAGLRHYCLTSALTSSSSTRKPWSTKSHETPSSSMSPSQPQSPRQQQSDTTLRSSSSNTSLNSSSSSSSSLGASNSNQPSTPPPMVVVFSRELDYITPLLVPVTFEALIHEVVGIDLGIPSSSATMGQRGSLLRMTSSLPFLHTIPSGIVKPPPPPSSSSSTGGGGGDDAKSDFKKMLLSGEKLDFYKTIQDVHISQVHHLLAKSASNLDRTKRQLMGQLEDDQTDDLDPQMTSSSLGQLKQASDQLGPILAQRRQLTVAYRLLDAVLEAMTRQERVEDIRGVQQEILQSGSGGSMNVASSESSNASDSDQLPGKGGSTGSVGDNVRDSAFVRLFLEWTATFRGDRTIDALRIAALTSVTHDGLGNELLDLIKQAVVNSAGHASLPLLQAIQSLGLVVDRGGSDRRPATSTVNDSTDRYDEDEKESTTVSLEEEPGGRRQLLLGRKRSRYNHLHYQFRLSHRGQLNQPNPISPSYVFAGEHCPLIVRLCESLWFIGVSESGVSIPATASTTNTSWTSKLLSQSSPVSPWSSSKATKQSSTCTLSDPADLLTRDQLIQSLEQLLVSGVGDSGSGLKLSSNQRTNQFTNLGLVSLADDPLLVRLALTPPNVTDQDEPSSSIKSSSLPVVKLRASVKTSVKQQSTPRVKPLPLLSKGQPIVVVFPGGCSYAEVAALRFAAKRRNWSLMVVTSYMLNSRDLIQQAGRSVSL